MKLAGANWTFISLVIQLSLIPQTSHSLSCIQCDSDITRIEDCISGLLSPTNCTNPTDNQCVTTSVTSPPRAPQVIWRSCGNSSHIPRCRKFPTKEGQTGANQAQSKNSQRGRRPDKISERDLNPTKSPLKTEEKVVFLCMTGCGTDGCLPPSPSSAKQQRTVWCWTIILVTLSRLSA